jgi:hypothetical protein
MLQKWGGAMSFRPIFVFNPAARFAIFMVMDKRRPTTHMTFVSAIRFSFGAV